MSEKNNFGFKVVDRDKTSIKPILSYLKSFSRPLEVGLYFANPAATDALRFCLAGSDVLLNTHLDHHQLNIFSVDEKLEAFADQIETSLLLGSTYSVTHISDFPMSPRVERETDVIDHLLANCIKLESLCESFGDYHIYIENTYHNLGFYRYLFECIAEAGLANIHFCFDIGHAKIWSQESFGAWIEFLLELQTYGFLLHFHLHNNAGIKDDHFSFLEAQDRCLNQPDYFTETLNYLEALQQIHYLFPRSRKVFEVKPEQALENLEFVLMHLCDEWDPYRLESSLNYNVVNS